MLSCSLCNILMITFRLISKSNIFVCLVVHNPRCFKLLQIYTVCKKVLKHLRLRYATTLNVYISPFSCFILY